MGARMAAVVLMGIVFAVPAGALAQQRQSILFGAIAYSAATRAIGIASDNATQEEAESVALQNCRSSAPDASDCKNVMWIRNACAAIAIGKDGGWGTDWASDRAAAERKALAVCAKYSSTCEVVRRVCTMPGR